MKFKKILISILFSIVIILSCEANTESNNRYINFTNFFQEETFYFKDNRTNLCFISNMTGLYNTSISISNVPCTKEVEKLIKNKGN